MQILDLCQHARFIPTLAAWHHAEWAHLNPGDSAEARGKRMEQYRSDGLPLAVVAVDEGQQPIGSAALIECDMHTHTELTPWLASVFVPMEHRHKGIGRTLVQSICDRAQQLGFERIYLFTPDRAHFYERMGWAPMYVEPYMGIEATVMSIDF